MKTIILDIINNGEFELKDILIKIDEMYLESKITKEDKGELVELAREKANHHKSYGATLEERVEALEKKVKALAEANKTDEPSIPNEEEPSEEEVVEEYPPFKQPLGGHDSYMKGDKCSENGKKFISLIDGNNWSPSVYPQGWEEVKEVE